MDSMINQLIHHAAKCTMEIKLAAGLFYSKKGFVGIGYNSCRTYMKKTIKPNIHAEDAVIQYVKARFQRMKTRHLKLIVIRVNTKKKLLLSKPCINCTKTIRDYGIRKVYYVNEQNELVSERISAISSYHDQFPNFSQTNLWFHTVFKGGSAVLPIVLQVSQHLKEEEHITFFTRTMGQTIKTLREERQWDQSELAKRLCLPKHILTNIEQGKPERYTPHLALKIRKCFGEFLC